MNLKEWTRRFYRWLDGDYDVMEHIMDGSREPDESHEEDKTDRSDEHSRVSGR